MKLLLLLVIVSVSACGLFSRREPQPTVPDVDLERYAGTWHEIARLPNRFERGLVGVTATYTLRDDGRITVLNQGRKETLDGEVKKAEGYAKVPDPDEPGRLRVYFTRFFGAAYLILALDTEQYQYAMVGSRRRRFLWILSRTPQLDPAIFNRLTRKAESLGYDTGALIMVEQADPAPEG